MQAQGDVSDKYGGRRRKSPYRSCRVPVINPKGWLGAAGTYLQATSDNALSQEMAFGALFFRHGPSEWACLARSRRYRAHAAA